MKLTEKLTAIKLRKRGLSYKDILDKIDVSKSSLSLWLRDIELTPKQQEKLFVGREKSRYFAGSKKKAIRILQTNDIIDKSKREASSFIGSPLFLAGLSLYWAEGTKNSNESVRFSNSDKAMIELMMRWFREICNVPEKKFRVQIHMHNLHCQPDLEKYWSHIVGVPRRQFYKTYIKETSLGQRKNILYNGTCTITVNSRELFRKIVGWKLGLQEYFNISP